jgi:hypothetical protein
MPEGATSKQCPFCDGVIPVVALQCPHCQRRVAGAGTAREFGRRLLTQELVLRQALRDGEFARAIARMGGKFRGRTLVFAAVCLLVGGALLASLFGPAESLLKSWDLLIFFAVLISLVIFIGALVDDLMLPAATARTSPREGLKAFLQALKLKRYAYAYNCLLPGEKNKRMRRRYAVQVTGTGSGKFTFAELKGFRGYWGPIFNPTSAETSMQFSEVKLVAETGDFAVVKAKLSASRKAGGIGGGLLGAALRGLMAKGQDIEIAKLLRCVEGQWYLVNGELFSPEDGALEELEGFARASDGELVKASKAARDAG